jgi:hypothetical protein
MAYRGLAWQSFTEIDLWLYKISFILGDFVLNRDEHMSQPTLLVLLTGK